MSTNPLGAVVADDTLPAWLQPAPSPKLVPAASTPSTPSTPTLSESRRIVRETQYQNMFPIVLDEIAAGRTLTNIVKDDIRDIEHGMFLRWIKSDPERHAKYKEAKELRTEHWAGEILTISDAEDSVEDVNRSKLRIDTRKWLMGADNRKQYGDVKTIDVGGSISIISALNAADNRLVELADVTDVSDKTLRLENEE